MIESYGLRLAVTVPDASFVPDLQQALPPVWESAADEWVDHDVSLEHRDEVRSPVGRAGWFVFVDGVFTWAPSSRADVRRVLENALEGCIAVNSPEFVFVHAGAVVWNDRAMLFPGYSYSGKSSLVAAMVDAGATYFSDEYAVIGVDGLIYPYPRRISLRDGDGRSRRRIAVPDDARGRPFTERGVLPGMLAAFHYEPGTSGIEVAAITPEETLGILLEHTLGVRARPAQVMSAIGLVANMVEAFQGIRGEAEITADLLLQGSLSPTRNRPRKSGLV